MKAKILSVLGSALLAGPLSASAAVVVLDFEGIDDGAAVGDYYNGGGGTNYGVSFSGPTLALIDADAGGSGNFANEPSPNTIMFFLDASNAILNYAAGFNTGFSFYYTSSTTASVTIWDDVDGTGNLLGTINLAGQSTGNGCTGDPSGSAFCNWTAVGVGFAGTAKSINFGGTSNQTGYDNITFGAVDPVRPVPLPAAAWLLLSGLGGLGFISRRRKTA